MIKTHINEQKKNKNKRKYQQESYMKQITINS